MLKLTGGAHNVIFGIKEALAEKFRSLPVQVKASFWFIICAFIQKGIAVVTMPIFTRLMTPEEYGMFGVFTSWQAIISVIITLNLFCGVYIQGLVKFEETRRQYSSSMQGLCLTLVLIWAAIYYVSNDFWNGLFSLTTAQMTGMLSIIWSSAVFGFWSYEQRVKNLYLKLVVITLIVSIANPVLGIFLVFHSEDKVTARIFGMAIPELAVYTWLFISQMIRGKQFFSRKIWKYALLFNLPLIPHYLSMSVLSTSDRIMIEKMTGAREAGIYSLAYSVSLIMTIFNYAMFQSIEPWLYKKIKLGQISLMSRAVYPALIIIAALNILLMVCAPEIISIFAPKTYYDAVWIIPPVAMSVFFTAAYPFFAVFEFYYEKSYLITIASLSGALLNIILNYIFIGIFGYRAAAYTTLLCYIFFGFMHYYFMSLICRSRLGNTIPYDARILAKISLIFVLTGFAILVTYNNIWLRCLLLFITAAAAIIGHKYIVSALKGILSLRAEK